MKKAVPLAVTICLAGLFHSPATEAQTGDPLRFPVNQFTLETKIVMTNSGSKEVVYRSYMHLPYVARPVDRDYQSLNISVPVLVDGVEIDATGSPVLFAIGVGGYMSVRNAGAPNGTGRMGGPPSIGMNPAASVQDLALAAGYVVVSPGCRGRDNRAADGTYYGKAPAAIVDLKAAVRYIRYNDDLIPGDADRIVSNGCSAGGALSALLGASGNSPLYEEDLREIGAAQVKDHIFAAACFSPITDLEHADIAYEWMYGSSPTRSGLVDQELSEQLKDAFAQYQASLHLQGKEGFGILSAENYSDYLLKYYLIPSANAFLNELSGTDRDAYLAENTWIDWSASGASFSFPDYVAHVGRMKGLPAFDDFQMRQPEPVLFGNSTTDARHFTNFSLRYSSGDPDAEIGDDLEVVVNMMNAMYFTTREISDCAGHWWIRNGSSDNHTSQTVFGNLVTSLENRGMMVEPWLYWDGGHCANDDPEKLIKWIGEVTGYR